MVTYKKVKVKVEIPCGKYCRDTNLPEFHCDFFWESEDGDTGCCLIGNSTTFIEGDISQVPKLDGCPNPK